MHTSVIAILAAMAPVQAAATQTNDVEVVQPEAAQTGGGGSAVQSNSTAPNSTTLTSTAHSGDQGYPDIVVTALKRDTRLQDVPISIDVVSGTQLEENGLHDLTQIRDYMPNLVFQEGSEAPAIIMRGFGNNGGTNFGFESPVGIYIDGIYHGRLNQARMAFLDVARIEVLRGPQSTLFGMNTVAGAISVVLNQPTDSLEGRIQVQYDPRYRGEELTGVISGPLSDTVSARLAAIATNEEGYLYNTYLHRRSGGIDDLGARLILRWKPTSQFTLSTRLEIGRRFQDGVNNETLTPPTSAAQLAQMLAIDPRASFTWTDLNISEPLSTRHIDSYEAAITAEYAFDNFKVTSISAYSNFRERGLLSLTHVPIVLGQIRAIEDSHQISQELRITSTSPGMIEYLAGIYFQRSRTQHSRPLDFILGNFIASFAGTPSGALQTYAGDFLQTYSTYAAFAQATWNITDTLHLTAGARYSIERKHGSSCFDWLTPGSTGCESALTPGTPAFAAADFVFNAVFRIVRHRAEARYRNNAFMPQAMLLWQASPEVNFYASFGQGEQAGGFNDRDNRNANFTFGPERSTNYEIGSKMRFLSGAIQLDVAIFHTRFKDLQISVFDLANLIFIVDNAAQATTRGVEVESRFRVSPTFSLNLSAGWLERARFDHYLQQCVPGPTSPGCVSTPSGNFVDVGGKDLNAPKVSFTIGFDYHNRIGSGLTLTMAGDANFRGSSADLVNNTGRIPPGTLLNGRIGLITDSGWHFAIIGRNLTNERQVLTRGTSLFAGSFTGEVTPPRAIAVQAGFSF